MKILFLSFSGLKFSEETPLNEPLGGTESAICYLAGALRNRGHEVMLFSCHDGLLYHSLCGQGQHWDVVIVANNPEMSVQAKDVWPSAKVVLWNHMLPDQPAMKNYYKFAAWIDETVWVSEKQRKLFCQYGINEMLPNGTIINNAIAPCFENMYQIPEQILSDKECRGAYTSTPFRGLDRLIPIREIPIDVYSSMSVYQMAETGFEGLYDDLSHNPAIKMHGSVPQPQLAHALRKAAFLTYPCTWDECQSIAILEAQAAGLMVITTERAMKFDGYACVMSNVDDFGMVLNMCVERYKDDPMRFAKEQFEQVKNINGNYTWAKRAAEWENMLLSLQAKEAA